MIDVAKIHWETFDDRLHKRSRCSWLWVASFGKRLLGKCLTGNQSQETLKTVHNDNEERCNINPALIRKELCCCSHTGSIWGCSNGMHHVSSSPLPVYLSLTLPAFSGSHEWLLQHILWIKVTLWVRKTVFVLHVSQQSHCAHVQLLALSQPRNYFKNKISQNMV